MTAAVTSSTLSNNKFMSPVAQKAPAMNSKLSPGKKNNTTRPVSQKIIANNTT